MIMLFNILTKRNSKKYQHIFVIILFSILILGSILSFKNFAKDFLTDTLCFYGKGVKSVFTTMYWIPREEWEEILMATGLRDQSDQDYLAFRDNLKHIQQPIICNYKIFTPPKHKGIS